MSSTFTDAPDLPLPSSYGDPERTGLDADDLFEGITEHLFFTLGRRVDNASPQDALRAHQKPRAVAYLSAEFLIGPRLGNNLLMLGIQSEAATALQRFGIQDIEQILALEEEPGRRRMARSSALDDDVPPEHRAQRLFLL
jgi:starch phosphorylase